MYLVLILTGVKYGPKESPLLPFGSEQLMKFVTLHVWHLFVFCITIYLQATAILQKRLELLCDSIGALSIETIIGIKTELRDMTSNINRIFGRIVDQVYHHVRGDLLQSGASERGLNRHGFPGNPHYWLSFIDPAVKLLLLIHMDTTGNQIILSCKNAELKILHHG